MKKIRIKFVDIDNTGHGISCFGEKQYSSFLDVLLNILQNNYEVEFSDEPDYVFSILPVGEAKGYEYYKYKDKIQCQILLENVRPDFNCFDYTIGSFHNISYADRYLYLPACLMSTDQPRQAYPKALEKHLNIDSSLAKRKFCSFVVSNGDNAALEREHFFHLLSKYKQVDSGGRFLNNVGGPIEDRVEFESQHKFSIVFENAWQSEITEKIDMAFAAKTVPIYWGNPDIEDIYNKKAFINCSNFDNFESVVEEVIRLDNNNEAYLNMLKQSAYRKPINMELWYVELEKFLINMIESPKDRAIIRSDVYWSKRLQQMRYKCFKDNYRKRIIRVKLAKFLGKVFKPFKASKIANEVKKIINRGV